MLYSLHPDDIIASLEKLGPNAAICGNERVGGLSCTFSAPSHPCSVLEKAGINISMIHEILPSAVIKQMTSEHLSVPYSADSNASLPLLEESFKTVKPQRTFCCTRQSLLLRDQQVNIRVWEGFGIWWFGGITDLAPSYLFEDDARRHFHVTLTQAACDGHGSAPSPAIPRSQKVW